MLMHNHDTHANLNIKHIDEIHEQAWDAVEQDMPRAIERLTEGYQLAEAHNYLKGIFDNQVVKALMIRASGEYSEILLIMAQAMAFYQEHAIIDIWRARAASMLGYAYSMLGDYANALEQYLHQLEICDIIKDDVQSALAYKDVGNLYIHKAQDQEALKYYLESLRYYEKVNIPQGLAAITNNLSLLFLRLKDLNTALRYALRSLSLFESCNHLNGQSRVCNNLGQIYLEQNEPNLSLHYFHRALIAANSANNHFSQTVALLSLGRMYKHLKQYAKAQSYLTQSLALAEQSQDKYRIYECHEVFSELYAAQGEWELALKHYQQFHNTQREVLNETSLAKFHGLELRYETQQALDEIETQKRLREQDRQYFERLTQLKDEFLATASHDLKNPITSIALALHTLQHYVTDSRGQQYIFRIENALSQMRYMITDLLDLAKLETGRALNVETVNLVELVQHEVSDFEDNARANQVQLHYETTHAALYADIDTPRIIRVLQNLLSNAIKYNRIDGNVYVQVSGNQDEIIVSIRDSGIGIPSQSLSAVFDRFYRVPTQHHLGVEGTGLGLAIAKSIIEQHQGRIWVESALNQGSTFTFTLPHAAL